MRSIFTIATMLLISTYAAQAFGHGEDQPGPHGGEIRMPGAFHVEVVRKPGLIQVYLLDMHFKNPTVKNSEVIASVLANGKTIGLKCRPEASAFNCPLPSSVKTKGALLQVNAQRGEQKTTVAAEYTL